MTLALGLFVFVFGVLVLIRYTLPRECEDCGRTPALYYGDRLVCYHCRRYTK